MAQASHRGSAPVIVYMNKEHVAQRALRVDTSRRSQRMPTSDFHGSPSLFLEFSCQPESSCLGCGTFKSCQSF
jgi:hypothetical protein